jgi:CheY-like chemotaxis protein
VVEDDPFFQRVLRRRLRARGYQVVPAGDGRDGMKAIVTLEPDLVISDWMMPHVGRPRAVPVVKTGLREAAPYFILLTAKSEISDSCSRSRPVPTTTWSSRAIRSSWSRACVRGFAWWG